MASHRHRALPHSFADCWQADIQYTAAERREMVEQKRKEIINYIQWVACLGLSAVGLWLR